MVTVAKGADGGKLRSGRDRELAALDCAGTGGSRYEEADQAERANGERNKHKWIAPAVSSPAFDEVEDDAAPVPSAPSAAPA